MLVVFVLAAVLILPSLGLLYVLDQKSLLSADTAAEPAAGDQPTPGALKTVQIGRFGGFSIHVATRRRTPGVEDLDVLPDAALMAAVTGRNADALEELYRRHSVAVFGVARRVTGVPEHGEEVLQEVFLRLWRSPERFDPSRGALRSFLLMDANAPRHRARPARRARVAAGRSARSSSPRSRRATTSRASTGTSSSPSTSARCSTRLSPTEREAIELAYYGDHTYREVATILGLPEGTVKSRIRSGLKRMRDRLVAADIGGPS